MSLLCSKLVFYLVRVKIKVSASPITFLASSLPLPLMYSAPAYCTLPCVFAHVVPRANDLPPDILVATSLTSLKG